VKDANRRIHVTQIHVNQEELVALRTVPFTNALVLLEEVALIVKLTTLAILIYVKIMEHADMTSTIIQNVVVLLDILESFVNT
jgi:hypothetical protein